MRWQGSIAKRLGWGLLIVLVCGSSVGVWRWLGTPVEPLAVVPYNAGLLRLDLPAEWSADATAAAGSSGTLDAAADQAAWRWETAASGSAWTEMEPGRPGVEAASDVGADAGSAAMADASAGQGASADHRSSRDLAAKLLESTHGDAAAEGGAVGAGDTAEPVFDTLVVCPAAWRETLEPWLAYRAAQGHRIGLVDCPPAPEPLKELFIQHHARGLQFVLLVGDVPSLFDFQGVGIPTWYAESEVSRRFGGRVRVATDHWYADLDDDGAPELAIGRWSVRSAEQLAVVIDKTLRFETAPDPAFARRRIEFVAGVGGFGAIEDKVLEGATTRLLTDLIPRQFDVGMTHASWRSVYCPGPEQYSEQVFASLNRGALFWVYMGHGSWNCLDSAAFPDRMVPTIHTGNAEQIASAVSPIALLLACSTGEFDLRSDCLAEHMQRAEQGPVAVIAGTGVTAPYGLASLGLELLTLYRDREVEEVGRWIQLAKRRMVERTKARKTTLVEQGSVEGIAGKGMAVEGMAGEGMAGEGMAFAGITGEGIVVEGITGEGGFDYRSLLEQLARFFSPTQDMLAQEIVEHANMMTYFGDPLLRFPRFEQIALKADASNGQWELAGQLPGDWADAVEVEVEVVHPLDRLGFRPQARRRYEANPEFAARLAEEYRRANDRVLHRTVVSTRGGSFWLPLASLGQLPDRFWIRASAVDGSAQALGFSEVDLRQSQPDITSVALLEVPPHHVQEQANGQQGVQEQTDLQPDVAGEAGTQQDIADGAGQESARQESASQERVIDLYDGQSTSGWKTTAYGGEGEVWVEEGVLTLEMGQVLTGITFDGVSGLAAKDMPREDYELRIRAKRIDGSDMFCGVTFPVADAYCSFVVGGWGGMTVGLSSVDGKDAARNATRTVHRFEPGQWYDLRVKVTKAKIECWIDQEQVVDQPREGHEFSIRGDVRLSEPLGIFCFQTTAGFEKIQIVRLTPAQK